MVQHGPAAGSLGRALEQTCKGVALAGGAILVALTGMAVGSIVGRSLGHPIQGDFELVQFGCAVAISFFLPHAQMRRANIIVDFFTVNASPRTRAGLDAFGAALLAAVMALLCWRVAAAAVELHGTQETSMILAVPVWYAYALISPAFGLTALAGAHTAAAQWSAR